MKYELTPAGVEISDHSLRISRLMIEWLETAMKDDYEKFTVGIVIRHYMKQKILDLSSLGDLP